MIDMWIFIQLSSKCSCTEVTSSGEAEQRSPSADALGVGGYFC